MINFYSFLDVNKKIFKDSSSKLNGDPSSDYLFYVFLSNIFIFKRIIIFLLLNLKKKNIYK